VIVRAVTLEVWPEQAEAIVRATQEGKVQLTLRNPLDGVRQEPVLADDAEPAAEAPAQPPLQLARQSQVVVVIRGTSISETTFGDERPTRVDFAR
jgi:pilus assembly protein CpaB